MYKESWLGQCASRELLSFMRSIKVLFSGKKYWIWTIDTS